MRKIFTGSFLVLALAGFLAGCVLAGAPGSTVASASRSLTAAPSLGTASSFAVLGGPAVTLTDSVVNGDLGYVGAYTNTRSVVNGSVTQINTNSTPNAYSDFVAAYDSLRQSLNTATATQLTGTLASVTLTPGVYTFDAAATLTGVLTLDAKGDPTAQWTFFIGTSGTGALTGTGFTVVMANGGDPCNVTWWVAQAATMTSSNFIGTIMAGAAITVTGGSFNGDALAQAAVTLTGVTLSGCTTPENPTPPVQLGIKVTGGGQIAVDSGTASFGFNAKPGKSGVGASGEFNYVNHVTGLHINGKVTYIAVTEWNADGSPLTVLFSGTYDGGTFIVTVQDQGEPGVNDQFGVIVGGAQTETESIRVISNGNIQFHK